MASLGRSSAMIAAGTLLSRITGLIRSILLVWVIGSAASRPADAFATATQLPNMIFTILSAGLLTAVFVPQIVKAARHDDGGTAFVSRLFTMATTVLAAVTLVATLAAPWLISLFVTKEWTDDQYALAVALAYWCIPQVLFFGLFALVGETLNAREVYGPYTWAPIANNVISIAGFAVFILLFDTPLVDTADWTPDRIALLGCVATGGIAAQFVLLLFFWRRARLRVRPDFRWRGVGLGDPIRLAGWTFLMVIVGQIAATVQTKVVNSTSGDVSLAVWNNAWLVFMLPYSVFVMAIGTPYFTRLSGHAAAGRTAEVRADIIASIRSIGVFVTLAAAALAAAAVPASRIFTTSRETALMATPVLLAFLVSLIPLSVLFIIQRTFYAFDDTRTPFVFTVVQAVLVMATALLAWAFVPLEWRTAAVALGQSLAIVVQVVLAVVLLRRKIGLLGGRAWMGALLRFVAAGVPAALVGYGWFRLLGGDDGWMVPDGAGIASPLIAAVGVLLIAAVCGVVYVAMLAILRAPELRVAVETVTNLVRR